MVVAILSVLAFTAIVGSRFLQPAYGGVPCSFTGSLSSSTVNQGTASVTVSGTDDCSPTSGSVDVYLYSGTCPVSLPATPLSDFSSTVTSSQFSQSIPTSSLTPGSYCVVMVTTCIFTSIGNGISTSSIAISQVSCFGELINGDPLTVTATPIPEYPVGLAVLAIFMIIGYAVIRRRTITKQN